MLKRLIELIDDDVIGRASLPPRTPYYSLPPIGMGTWAAESTTSYVARLAANHCVSVIDLVTNTLDVRTRRGGTHWKLFPRQGGTFKLNGVSTTAMEWGRKLANLTLQPSLSKTNLTSLREMLPSTRLVRNTRAWCHLCLCEMQENTVYEPLLWSMHHAVVCPEHHVPLSTICPSCKAPNTTALSQRYTLGHCTRCGSWLGISNAEKKRQPTQWEEWTTLQMKSLISVISSSENTPSISVAYDNLEVLILTVGEGRMMRFAKKIDANKSTCSGWLNRKNFPTLDYCFRIGLVSGIDIGKLFCSVISPSDIDQTIWNQDSQPPWGKRPVRRKIDWACVRKNLEEICQNNETPPPGLQRVAKRLEVDGRLLKERFPDLCGRLAQKNTIFWSKRPAQRHKVLKKRIHRMVIEITKNGYWPSKRRVARALGLPGGDIKDGRLHQVWRDSVAKLQASQVFC